MELFDLCQLGSLIQRSILVQRWCDQFTDRAKDIEDRKSPIETCEKLAKYCGANGFRRTRQAAMILVDRLKDKRLLSPPAMEVEFSSIDLFLAQELQEHRFVQLNPKMADYFAGEDILAPEVLVAFPSLERDTEDAGNCIALGMGTAAVFYLMRIVEYGMRGLASNLGLLTVVIDRKNKKEIPVEFSEWERILNQLPVKVEQKIESLSRGPAKQRAQEFYYPALKEINGFKEAWRNHVMHARSDYTAEDAIAVLSHVRRFMKELTDYGICEKGKRKNAKR